MEEMDRLAEATRDLRKAFEGEARKDLRRLRRFLRILLPVADRVLPVLTLASLWSAWRLRLFGLWVRRLEIAVAIQTGRPVDLGIVERVEKEKPEEAGLREAFRKALHTPGAEIQTAVGVGFIAKRIERLPGGGVLIQEAELRKVSIGRRGGNSG